VSFAPQGSLLLKGLVLAVSLCSPGVRQCGADLLIRYSSFLSAAGEHRPAGIALESPQKKARVFLVLIVFLWWFLEHTRKVFGEICERQ
jgi:hypothetical protein